MIIENKDYMNSELGVGEQRSELTLHQGIKAVDMQYEICSAFLRNTGEHIFKHELCMMAKSNTLLDRLLSSHPQEEKEQSNIIPAKYKLHQTEGGYSTQYSDNVDIKLLTRKSPRAHAKFFEFAYMDELKDIQDKCSSSTFNTIKQLIHEQKNMKKNFNECQLKLKKQQRQIDNLLKQQEKYYMYIFQGNSSENKEQQYQAKIQSLQKQLQKHYKSEQAERMKENVDPVFTPKVLSEMVNYLNQKQKAISQKMKRIIHIQQNILNVVNYEVKGGCNKCCGFMKRIKDFIIQLRGSLQFQTEEIEKIYNKYKRIFVHE